MMGRIRAALLTAVFVTTGTMAAETVGPATGHTFVDLRAYSDGNLVFQFTPALAAGCQYNDHAEVLLNAAAYKLISALATSAFNVDQKVRLIYNGCTTRGAVNLVGLMVLK
jgi:hypothetical protein